MYKMHFYGSLRVGQYNYSRFKDHFADGLKLHKTERLHGYALFGVKGIPYPFVVKTGVEQDSIEVDTMSCNKECHSVIQQMEIGAGYKEEKHGDALIYTVDPHKLPKNAYKIADGNWLMELKRLKAEGEL